MTTRYGVWVLAAMLAAPVAARANGPDDQDRDGRITADQAPQLRSFTVGANGSLKLSNVSGDVKVTGGAGT